MQNLRDKLLKAGKVNKKQMRQAEHSERQSRRKRKKKKNKGEAPLDASVEREQLYQAKLAEQNARNQVFADAERAKKARKEQDLRARYLADYYSQQVRRGKQRWYFVARDGKILHLMVDDAMAYNLEHGLFAIVERPRATVDEAQHCFVERHAADLIWSIEDPYVRFYNRKDTERPPRAWETGLGELDPTPR